MLNMRFTMSHNRSPCYYSGLRKRGFKLTFKSKHLHWSRVEKNINIIFDVLLVLQGALTSYTAGLIYLYLLKWGLSQHDMDVRCEITEKEAVSPSLFFFLFF